jgi:hypothetical protein
MLTSLPQGAMAAWVRGSLPPVGAYAAVGVERPRGGRGPLLALWAEGALEVRRGARQGPPAPIRPSAAIISDVQGPRSGGAAVAWSRLDPGPSLPTNGLAAITPIAETSPAPSRVAEGGPEPTVPYQPNPGRMPIHSWTRSMAAA